MSDPRPLSPFLHYRWQYTNTLSIVHRGTGIVLCLAYLGLLYWLSALASGPTAYAHALRVLGSPFFKGLLSVALVAFAFHFCNGIRHLFWDAGIGLERREARRSARLVGIGTFLIALLFAIAWFSSGGG
jgi:succinate dehydrogenase / fumarate reductase cytochrome b subunit